MKDQLISFETAKLANEKGFHAETGNAYFMVPNKGPVVAHKALAGTEFPQIADVHTQSLLQKWLREVHSLSVKIDDYITNSRVRYDYSVSDLGSQEDNPIGVFETYEEALEQGLQEALSLIK